jgi:hypothetical protein
MNLDLLYSILIVGFGTAIPAVGFARVRAPFLTWLLAVAGYFLFWITLSLAFLYHPAKNPGPLLVALASWGTGLWVFATCRYYSQKAARQPGS